MVGGLVIQQLTHRHAKEGVEGQGKARETLRREVGEDGVWKSGREERGSRKPQVCAWWWEGGWPEGKTVKK